MFKRTQQSLKTDRLILRPFCMDDVTVVAALVNDKEIAEKTRFIPHPYTKQMAIDWISTHKKAFLEKKQIIFAIMLKKSSVLVGAISLTSSKTFVSDSQAELGYWIGKKYWNQGYCTEAAKSILQYGFTQLKLKEIIAEPLVSNYASCKVLQKLGMSSKTTKEDFFEASQKNVTLCCYKISVEEYFQIQKQKLNNKSKEMYH